MRKIFLVILSCCHLSFAFQANADEQDASLTLHMAIIMPAETAKNLGDDPALYEGVDFPLFCGIASVYPKENRFVFTKMTDLPVRNVEDALGKIERDGYLTVGRFQPPVHIQPRSLDFFRFFLSYTPIRNFEAYLISYAQEIPVDYMPHFTRTCRYSIEKTPPTDCAYDIWEIKDVYIPPTDEELEATIEQSE